MDALLKKAREYASQPSKYNSPEKDFLEGAKWAQMECFKIAQSYNSLTDLAYEIGQEIKDLGKENG